MSKIKKVTSKFSILTSHLSPHKAFTLIELLVVFGIIGILTALGIAGYSSYNSTQLVESSAQDVATMLNTAKERALAQVVPGSCGNNSVSGYQVDFTINGQQYTLSAICGSKQLIMAKNLPPKVTFANGTTPSVLFSFSDGTVANTPSILLTGFGKQKTINVNNIGIVSVKPGTTSTNTSNAPSPTAIPTIDTGLGGNQNQNCQPDSLLVNPCRPWFGASVGSNPKAATDPISQFDYLENQIGHQIDIFHDYHPAGNLPLNTYEIHYAQRANTYIYVNWKPASDWPSAGGGNATINSQIDQAAANIKAIAPIKIFMTVWHEPENDVSAFDNTTEQTNCQSDTNFKGLKGTAGTPAQYQAMWQNVRNRFASDGVTNVVWVMNYMNYKPWQCLVPYMWPGNNNVDWVTFESYTYGSTSFQSKIADMYNLLQADNNSSHDFESKPWGIAEFEDCVDTDQTLVYKHYQEMQAVIDNNTYPRLKMYMAYANANGPNAGPGCLSNYSVAGSYDSTEQYYFNLIPNDPLMTK